MTVFERQVRDSKLASRSVLPAIDPDCTCSRYRPKNCFAAIGKRDTSKKKVYLDDITVLLRENIGTEF